MPDSMTGIAEDPGSLFSQFLSRQPVSRLMYSSCFERLPEGTGFTCSSRTVKSVKNGKYVIARIRGIKASELEKEFTVTPLN